MSFSGSSMFNRVEASTARLVVTHHVLSEGSSGLRNRQAWSCRLVHASDD
jgi:hypothetical protein